MYIKENHNKNSYYDEEYPIQEDDVMSLINTIMANTKSENIQNTSGDPFWEKAEMIYMQALFYYTFRHYDKAHQNFTTILNLIRLSNPDANGVSSLDKLFDSWAKKEPEAIGVKQYKHFKVAASAPKMMSTIIMVATARIASFNIKEIADMTETDTMELNRIGMPIDDNSPLLKQINSESNKHIGNGKVAYFVITKPSNNTFNYLASIFYTQIFEIIDENSKLCGGSLATPLEIYMDEWSQLGEIPRFVEELAYLRGLNVGITVGLQSLSQLKQKYKDSWESVLDCCDSTLFLGGTSKETLEYLVALLGKKTWYKKSSGRTYARQGSTSTNWDVVGRELATLDELSKMPAGNCVLFIAGIGAFYSKLYNLNEHPNYTDLYEPRENNFKQLYNHKKEMQYGTNADYKMLCDSGLSFAIPIEKLEIKEVGKNDLKDLKRTGVIQFEDLVIKK